MVLDVGTIEDHLPLSKVTKVGLTQSTEALRAKKLRFHQEGEIPSQAAVPTLPTLAWGCLPAR